MYEKRTQQDVQTKNTFDRIQSAQNGITHLEVQLKAIQTNPRNKMKKLQSVKIYV